MPLNVRTTGLALALCLGSMSMAAADTLLMDSLQDGDADSGERPQRGQTKEQVEASLGEPETRREAVGDPPITRWDYSGFSVYFEYDRVLRAVQQR